MRRPGAAVDALFTLRCESAEAAATALSQESFTIDFDFNTIGVTTTVRLTLGVRAGVATTTFDWKGLYLNTGGLS